MKIIYGPKGTGKTKAIIYDAQITVDTAKGHVIFVTDTSRYTYDLKSQIRYINVKDFDIHCAGGLRGFLKGIVAANGDNEYIYLDGIARITGKELSELASVFGAMEKLEQTYGVKFIVTCSANKEELPEFVLKYVD